ncbi:GDP-L-fucose synthase [Pseudomonadota bacterium]|jgi:GDP-L-fucose synthase|nr:GDP-L-fucose synthase [Pseudomonadota bacterium]
MSQKNIFVAGHNGMVGSSVCRNLHNASAGKYSVITAERAELDLTNQSQVLEFFRSNRIDYVYLCAAKVGGIHANNKFPADFIYQNLMIEMNIIHSAFLCGVQNLLFLGSSCIYPRDAIQPMTEDVLLSGRLEATNEPYAIAKIAGIKACESYNRQHGTDYRSIMPTNLYGFHDNFHPLNSHVIPGLIRRFHEAKQNRLPEIMIWGTGTAMREFLFVDDLADACSHIMEMPRLKYVELTDPQLSHLNIGSGIEHSIAELANIIKKIIKYDGQILFDDSKPEGPPRKLMDSSKLLSTGWTASHALETGIECTYSWLLDNLSLLKD